jgi:hypothetical protein
MNSPACHDSEMPAGEFWGRKAVPGHRPAPETNPETRQVAWIGFRGNECARVRLSPRRVIYDVDGDRKSEVPSSLKFFATAG